MVYCFIKKKTWTKVRQNVKNEIVLSSLYWLLISVSKFKKIYKYLKILWSS